MTKNNFILPCLKLRSSGRGCSVVRKGKQNTIIFSPWYFIKNIPLFAVIPFPSGQFSNLSNLNLQDFISYGINVLLVVSAVLFFFTLLSGGIKMMLSGGEKTKKDDATATITNAFIGLTIVFSTWAVLSLVGTFFGVNILSLQLP